MAHPIYYVPAGDVLPIFFDSFDGGTGASAATTGLAVTDIEIYKDGSVTQRASDAGYTLLDTDGLDFDGITGINGFSIDTGDNTDASFYTVGAWFTVVVSSVTIDAQTVNFIAAQFRIMPAETVAGTPKVDPSTWDGTDITTGVPLAPTTAGRTLDVSAAGEAGLDINNIAALTAGPLALFGITESGTAQSATATTLVGRAAATNDTVKAGQSLFAYGSDQAYWQTVMIDSVSGDTFTIAAWPVTTPTGTISYLIFGTPTISSAVPVAANVTQIGGDSQSATDLKDFADAGYDPSTNKVQGVVLTDTVTTYTGNTVQTGDSFGRIGATGSGLTSLASQASVNTIDDFLDAEIAAILALLDDPRTEPGQGSPPVNPDLATKIDYLYKAWRNRSTQTATEYALYADDGTTKDQEAACSDDGTTFVRGEVATGA